MLKIILTSLLASHLILAAPTAPTPIYNKTEISNVAKSAITSLTSMRSWNTSWNWGTGVGLYGIWKHYEATHDPTSLNAVQNWYSTRLPKGQKKHVNTMAVMSTLVDLYNTTHDPQWLPYIEDWGFWCMYNLTRTEDGGMQHIIEVENKQQLWIDTLMMAAVPLAKIGRVLGKQEYVREARKQFDIHIKYLRDAKTGLFFHGWTFIERDNFAGARWARGNAWAAVTMAEILELVYEDPREVEEGRKLLDVLDAQLLALQPLQDRKNDGLWRTVLDYPVANGSYVETSASAGFVYAYLKTKRKGWTGGRDYATTIDAGVKGILKNVASNGEVKNVSAGTGMGNTIDHYFKIKKQQTEWGQSLAVMALTEVLRTLE